MLEHNDQSLLFFRFFPPAGGHEVNSASAPELIRVGPWTAERASGLLRGESGEVKLEPKVMDLLWLLAANAGSVVSRERILAALWPDVIVGEDALARCISKLRLALGDDARTPRYIETIAKRGYRLLLNAVSESPSMQQDSPAAVSSQSTETSSRRRRYFKLLWQGGLAVVVVMMVAFGTSRVHQTAGVQTKVSADTSTMLAHADDAYFQFSRADNEAAIELYQRVLALRPDDAVAHAGLANALTQRCIRWPATVAAEFTQLRDALASGHLRDPQNQLQLQRAQGLAERAVALAPNSAAAHKAMGFVHAAQGKLDAALRSYQRAVALDPDNWGALINIGDSLEILGKAEQALAYFERAYEAMSRVYARNPAQVRPWQSRLGVLLAQRHRQAGRVAEAEAWYRRILAQSPLHPEATRQLAAILRDGGDSAQAERMCSELAQRLGAEQGCKAMTFSGSN